MSDFAHVGERMDEFRAGALTMSQQARYVAPVDAAARDEKIVARAPCDAAQLKLALRRRSVPAKPRASERESRITLDAGARGKQRVTLDFALQPARVYEQVLDGEDGVNGRALYALDSLLVGYDAFVKRLRFACPRLRIFEKEDQRRQRPCERGGSGLK